MANLENIDRVIAKIKDEQNYFNMCWFSQCTEEHPCGTAACIGGWAADIMLRDRGEKPDDESIESVLTEDMADFFGIDEKNADELFFPAHKDLLDITREEAIATLEDLKATDKVEWVKL